jgi:acyl-CoA dehydrogenase
MDTTATLAAPNAIIELGESFPEIRQGVRAVCERFPGEYWRRLDEQRQYPIEFVQALTQSGYLSALIPEEYGGLGLLLSAGAAILEEVHASGCNGGTCHAQMYTMGTLLRHGSPEQKSEYLPRIASGELRLQAFGVTEPEVGTDTTKLRTRAVREGDCYVVNGHKGYLGRAAHSDLMLLLVRTTPLEEVAKKTEGLSVLLVDMREAVGSGMELRPVRTMMNHSAVEVFIEELRVPARNLIGEEGKGFRYILDSMNAERLLIASECIGDARWFLEKASDWARERVVFGRPIGQNQGIQFPLAHAYASMTAAQMIIKKGCALFEAGERPGEEANIALMLSSEASWEAANAAIQTFGGRGFDAEYDVERKFRETRLYQVAPISRNLILSYIAVHVLGLPRSF